MRLSKRNRSTEEGRVRAGRRHLWAGLLLCVALLVPLRAPASPPGNHVAEYKLKAVFLYNFAKFVEWPDTAFSAPDQPLVIGIMDSGSFSDEAIQTIERNTVGPHPLRVVHCKDLRSMQACHILFLNCHDDLMIKSALRSLETRPILTVGEREGFIRWGGIINFHLAENALRIQINRTAAQQAQLTLSAQLLEVAIIVEESAP